MLGTANVAMVTGGEDRPEAVYRYSVKCDRAMFLRIEYAARKADLSPNSFVQRHFDSILDPKPNQTAAPASTDFDLVRFKAIEFSKRYLISIGAARTWGVLRSRAKADGTVQISQRDLGIAINGTAPGRMVERLMDASLLELVQRGYGPQAPIYRVLGEV